MRETVFPEGFEKRMKDRLGNDWPKFAEAHRQPAPVSIRINPAKSTPLNSEKIPWTDFGYSLTERPAFTFDPLFHAGAYYVQEASSMFLEQALKQTTDLTRPLRVLDLCAAPGGKSTHLLSLLSENSLLVSNEVIRSRATILAENICKWGNINVIVTNNDPEDFKNLTGFFDVIVVDAPCSGEGLFRKNPEAMQEWSEENVAHCSLRQQRIVNTIWPALKQNGVLIYCTCTYSEKENEENIKWLVDNKKAESVALKVKSDWGVEEIHNENSFGYRFYPHKITGEGFFISVLQKKECEEEIKIKVKKKFDGVTKEIISRISEWLSPAGEVCYILHNDLVLAIGRSPKEEIEFLSQQLKVIQKGTALATVKHDKLIPEHALALSVLLNKENFTTLELNREQAIFYLRKDTLTIGAPTKGFILLTYQHVPLGWVNHLGNRTNNLYPTEWRIRNQEILSG
ncbi:MAG: rRNA methyltransferase [Bacteroidetes bacterium]|nr:rRNA methyltransferase [Bacteroidota bacterium]